MKKKLLPILFLLVSCTSLKQENLKIHDLDIDFPMADTISMEHRWTFDIPYNLSQFAIKDSIFFAIGNNRENMGYCYNINNGEPLNTIINYGKAANEILPENIVEFHGDSIQFINYILREIKSISMDDILTMPLGERKMSKIVLPKIIGSLNYKKIDNNMVIGHNYKNDKNAKYFIFNNELTLFGKYNTEILESTVNQELTPDVLASQYYPYFASCGSKVISADRRGITLELIDPNTKSIIKDRFYSKFTFGQQSKGVYSGEPTDLNTKNVYCTNTEIYCIVTQFDKTKKRENGNLFVNIFILVFDWELTPIRKYYIGSSTSRGYSVCMTDDCKKFYYLAFLEEKYSLFEGIIN